MPVNTSPLMQALGMLGQSNAALAQRREQQRQRRAGTVGGIAGLLAGGTTLAMTGNPAAAGMAASAGQMAGTTLAGGGPPDPMALGQLGLQFAGYQQQQDALNQQQQARQQNLAAERAQIDAMMAGKANYSDVTPGNAPLPEYDRTMQDGGVEVNLLNAARNSTTPLSAAARALQMHQSLQPKAPEPFTLPEGAARFDGQGKPIAVNPKLPSNEDRDRKARMGFEWGNSLRDEYTQGSKPFIAQRDAFNRIMASAVDPSGAGDIALLVNYMKLLDPGSVVREGEFATAQNAGGVDDKVRGLYNRLVSGERLTPEQRLDFTDRAGKIYSSAEKEHLRFAEFYRSLAKRHGVPEENVIIPYSMQQEANHPAVARKTAPADAPAVPGAGGLSIIPRANAAPVGAPAQGGINKPLHAMTVQELVAIDLNDKRLTQEQLMAIDAELRKRGY